MKIILFISIYQCKFILEGTEDIIKEIKSLPQTGQFQNFFLQNPFPNLDKNPARELSKWEYSSDDFYTKKIIKQEGELIEALNKEEQKMYYEDEKIEQKHVEQTYKDCTKDIEYVFGNENIKLEKIVNTSENEYCNYDMQCCSQSLFLNLQLQLKNYKETKFNEDIKNLELIVNILDFFNEEKLRKSWIENKKLNNLIKTCVTDKDHYFILKQYQELRSQRFQLVEDFKNYFDNRLKQSYNIICQLCNKNQSHYFQYNPEDDQYKVQIDFKNEVLNFYLALQEFTPFSKLIQISRFLDCVYNEASEVGSVKEMEQLIPMRFQLISDKGINRILRKSEEELLNDLRVKIFFQNYAPGRFMMPNITEIHKLLDYIQQYTSNIGKETKSQYYFGKQNESYQYFFDSFQVIADKFDYPNFEPKSILFFYVTQSGLNAAKNKLIKKYPYNYQKNFTNILKGILALLIIFNQFINGNCQ